MNVIGEKKQVIDKNFEELLQEISLNDEDLLTAVKKAYIAGMKRGVANSFKEFPVVSKYLSWYDAHSSKDRMQEIVAKSAKKINDNYIVSNGVMSRRDIVVVAQPVAIFEVGNQIAHQPQPALKTIECEVVS